MPRIVVLGCGTGVGKTRTSVALALALTRAGCSSLGLKPIESGTSNHPGSPAAGSDARALTDASSLRTDMQHPLYAFRQPVSPHLAARFEGKEIEMSTVAEWVSAAEASVTPFISSHMAIWSVVESAGGVFSPLSQSTTNFDLALALEPAIWILVAADALGVLHDISATMQAMQARGRLPDHVVLSAARQPDASTGSNARELSSLGIVTPTAVLARDDYRGIHDLVRALLIPRPHAT